MSWGRGGQVGVNKAIYAHERALRQAAVILELECGLRHKLGERVDLCPRCQANRDNTAKAKV